MADIVHLPTAAPPKPFKSAGRALERSGILGPATVRDLIGDLSHEIARMMIGASGMELPTPEAADAKALAYDAAVRAGDDLVQLIALLAPTPPKGAA